MTTRFGLGLQKFQSKRSDRTSAAALEGRTAAAFAVGFTVSLSESLWRGDHRESDHHRSGLTPLRTAHNNADGAPPMGESVSLLGVRVLADGLLPKVLARRAKHRPR